ncbi:glycosyltransferase [Coxiella endosymbiont of Ornithodoros maritimus]|uniref:glycosyltransferase n=1 Tax=Coxiella endosymbiont of Ornithodoros maritimus TaxID=1656172 RepID=UPI002263B342|nr:glycosyltransferase [Coxiella endosymbiont of Ornithodoros maritimus]
MKKKKIDLCLVIPDMGGGGTQRVLMNLVKHWLNQGKKICVITFFNKKSDFFELPIAISRKSINLPDESKNLIIAIWNNLRRVKALRSVIKAYQPKLVLSFLVTSNVLTILATFFMRIPVIVSERSDPTKDSLGSIWDKLRHLLYRYADIVTANSHDAIVALEKFIDPGKLKYVPNPICIEEPFRPLTYSFPAILAVGRLSYEKGHDILLLAFSKFIHHFLQWRLIIVGDGELRNKLKQFAVSLNIDKDIIWGGMQLDIFSYYNAATIFVMPSRYEGTPNALLEAMSCGLPAIVSNASSGILHFVKNEETGLVVPVEDVEALYLAFCRLGNDELFRKRLGEKARQKITGETQCSYELWDNVLHLMNIRL